MTAEQSSAVVEAARQLVSLTEQLFQAKEAAGRAADYTEWLVAQEAYGRLLSELCATELRLQRLFDAEEVS